MSNPKSTHLPEVSGAIEDIPSSGSLIVDTGLRNVRAFTVTMASTPAAAAATCAGVLAEAEGLSTKLTLKVVKADGVTAADQASKVSWVAIGE
jgi:hypothetical protein